MYVPNHFKVDDAAALQQYLRDYSFGLLIIADEHGVEANHLPFYFCEEPDSLGYLQCHLARSNPAWKRLQNRRSVLAVLQGPDAYISPSWYPSKKENGRAVPTWNYLAVHVEGSAQVVEDSGWLKKHLSNLTDQHESGREEPWAVDDAPADFTNHLLKGIVGIEIKIDRITGKLKASQNQPETNRGAVKAALEEEGERGRAMAKLIR